MDAREILGLLAEDSRLKVVAALALGARTLGEVDAATGLDARDVGRALARLEEAGLVESEPTGGWRLRAELLKDAARAAAPVEPREEFGDVDRETDRVLRAFVRAGRLTRIPAVRSKRLVVLDHIARVFEVGVRYPERQVDAMLRSFHEDHASLRRYLVDEGYLSRANGVYWRSGGSVEV